MELELKKARLKMYLDAEAAILNNQSYTIGDRSLTRADLGKVQAQIESLLAEINLAELKGGRRIRAVLVD